jgi:Cu2+-exporting ATPase
MGVNVYMITGDSEDVAKWVAEELNIDRYFANVLPHEKAEKVRDLMRMGYRVAMVGDGVNDAPALASAQIGIAIGAGTDVAIESANIILVGNDPRGVVKVLEIARKSYSKMIQNLWWAAGYNAITIPMAAGVLSNLGLTIPPAIGAIIMSVSDVIVTLNSSTLRRYEPKIPEYMEKYITIDPVCGMEVDPSQAYGKIEYKGITIYFCSQECQEKFKRNPEKYFTKLLRSRS